MYCPHCGTKAGDHQKFCRACGLHLLKLSQVLTNELAELDPGLLKKHRQGTRWFQLAYAGGILLLLGSKILDNGPQAFGLSMLIGIALLVFVLADPLGLFSSSREKLTDRRSTEPEAPATSEDRLLPEAHSEPSPSVTERTTELLAANKPHQSER